MNIGILTFQCAHNYGAMLQAYALQKTLERIDSNKNNLVEFINYRPEYITKGYREFPIDRFSGKNFIDLIKFFKNIAMSIIYYHSRHKRSQKFNCFEKKWIKLSSEYVQNQNISIKNYDAIICGSDQIWNPKITKGFDKIFFCDFKYKNPECKKIAYAVSLGISCLTDSEKKQIAGLVNNFDYISMRETEGCAIVNELYTKNEIVNTLDPTLLLDENDWADLIKEPNINKPYLLVYRMDSNDKIIKDAYTIAKKKNLKVLEISYRKSVKKIFSQRHKIITTAGPNEFLGLIKNADIVLTNSFHGTVFSIVFRKFFFSYPMGQISSRITSILELLHLKERFIAENDAEVSCENIIDYLFVDNLLNYEKNKSFLFIKKALEIHC